MNLGVKSIDKQMQSASKSPLLPSSFALASTKKTLCTCRWCAGKARCCANVRSKTTTCVSSRLGQILQASLHPCNCKSMREVLVNMLRHTWPSQQPNTKCSALPALHDAVSGTAWSFLSSRSKNVNRFHPRLIVRRHKSSKAIQVKTCQEA